MKTLTEFSPGKNDSIHAVSMHRRFVYFLLFEVIAVIVALFYGKSVGDMEKPFKEGELLTGFSFIQLLAVSGYSWGIFRIHEVSFNLRALKAKHVVWLFISLGFLFLAFDEVFEIHEKTDYLIHEVFQIRETGFTDRIDDLIILLYGLTGMFVIYHYRDGLKKYVSALPYLKWAFTFLYIMVLLDVITNRNDIIFFLIKDSSLAGSVSMWLRIAEDGFKFIAEGAFFGIAFRCSQIIYTDPLITTSTSIDLYNAIKKIHHKYSRYGQNYGIIICDVDDFDNYVNSYGHVQGNNIIKFVADRINNSLRYSDDVFRRSGREILIIASHQNLKETSFVAERLRRDIESLNIEHKGADRGILTMSFGVSAFDKEHITNWKSVIISADKALNKARSSGRNRVCHSDDIAES
ncbi:MAG: GGDEF domain-containing protein [Nitrospirae bacterium]|nr:GGDEF domain-containing protein [Nitrospirota bacterium]